MQSLTTPGLRVIQDSWPHAIAGGCLPSYLFYGIIVFAIIPISRVLSIA